MNRVLGIDFSGASDAGRKIWIAEGRSTGSGTFGLERLFPASALPQSGVPPAEAVCALARHIAGSGSARVGCDFPFGLPFELVEATDWRSFALDYADRYPDPETFRLTLRRHALRREYKRRTDRIARTPFNSYNLRLYRQTWWGIARVLVPLVKREAIAVRPQQRWAARRPQVLEVCAASTLKSIDLYPPYKGRGPRPARARRQILEALIERQLMAPPERPLRRILFENYGGDALDAVIGAIAAMRADLHSAPDPFQRLEGRVYFEV